MNWPRRKAEGGNLALLVESLRAQLSGLGSGLVPPQNGSWGRVGVNTTAYIDFQNSSGNASDLNPPNPNGTGWTPQAPLRTFRGLTRWWGTIAPVWSGLSYRTIYMSDGDLSGADSAVAFPLIYNGCIPSVEGSTPTVLSAPQFTRTAARNRAPGANSLLCGTLSFGVIAPGTPVDNVTPGKLSRSFFRKVAGSQWAQPFAHQSPGSGFSPAQVNSWNTNDILNVLQYTKADIACFLPQIVGDNAPSFTNALTIWQLRLIDPNGFVIGAGNSSLQINANVWFTECVVERDVSSEGGGFGAQAQMSKNCYFLGGYNNNTNPAIVGGVIEGLNLSPPHDFGVITADAIISSFANVSGAQVGIVYLDCPLDILGEVAVEQSLGYGTAVWYGSTAADVRLHELANLGLHDGITWTQALTYPNAIALGVVMNNTRQAFSMSVGGGVGTINGPITTTVNNLDAPVGPAGFGGVAFRPGGASLAGV